MTRGVVDVDGKGASAGSRNNNTRGCAKATIIGRVNVMSLSYHGRRSHAFKIGSSRYISRLVFLFTQYSCADRALGLDSKQVTDCLPKPRSRYPLPIINKSLFSYLLKEEVQSHKGWSDQRLITHKKASFLTLVLASEIVKHASTFY